MPELSKDLIALLQYLAPGFLVAWVFFGLTAHNKPSQFERVVQALIFTVVIQVLVLAEERSLKSLGRTVSLGQWTETSALVAAMLTALLVGVCLSACVNADAFHLRPRGALQTVQRQPQLQTLDDRYGLRVDQPPGGGTAKDPATDGSVGVRRAKWERTQ